MQLGTGYWKTLNKESDFDIILRSAEQGRTRNKIFSMVSIELNSTNDFLLIKIESINVKGLSKDKILDLFTKNYERLEFKFSGSEI